MFSENMGNGVSKWYAIFGRDFLYKGFHSETIHLQFDSLSFGWTLYMTCSEKNKNYKEDSFANIFDADFKTRTQ